MPGVSALHRRVVVAHGLLLLLMHRQPLFQLPGVRVANLGARFVMERGGAETSHTLRRLLGAPLKLYAIRTRGVNMC